MIFLKTYLTAIILVYWCLANELPSFIHVCHRADPNMKQCLMAAVEDIRPYLVTGLPEYNIPSLEPLVMQDLISEDAAGMKITTSNVSAYGCSDFFVRGMDIDTDAHLYKLYIDIPKLRIQSHYSVDGKLLLLPIRGNGNMEANITECVSTTIMQGELYEKNGESYLRFVSSKLSAQIGGGHVRLENLFNGDKLLLGVLNDVINKNLDAFLKELMPIVEKALAAKFLEIANDIVAPFTFDQLFPQ
ncbi:JHBP domain containing protein [Asbolus verrucosus]|uniref:JHBP domain containing protein n=1 Tax=Asbolus verrucosus TaxID=1661398 RepID=A0A482W235_ASBVE|nr:JHBP domain containing protein [Asbolus verrucosus]